MAETRVESLFIILAKLDLLLPIRRLLLPLLAIALLATTVELVCDAQPVEPPAPKRVLVLMPFQTSRPGSVAVLRGIEDGLRANYPGSVDVVADNVNAVPPEPENYRAQMSEWLAYKYGRQHFDAVVAVISPPVPFAIALRDRLWPDAPILFLIQEEDRERFPKDVPRSSRVIVALSNTETVRSALQMLPATQHLAVLEGSSEQDVRSNTEIVGNIRRALPDLDIIEIAGLSWDETKTRVKSLPAQSIILVGSFFFDRDHREFTVPQQIAQLVRIANAPIFADSDIGIGKGAVGGSVLTVQAAGFTAGEQIADLLKGADPGSLPIRETRNSYIVDWRQLQRWHIPLSRLPADATILYKPPTAWEQYSRYIIVFATVLALLLALVTFLLIERQRRRKEEKLNSAMLQSLPGLALLVNRDGMILRTNQGRSMSSNAAAIQSTCATVGCRYHDWIHQAFVHADGDLKPILEVIAGSRLIAAAEVAVTSGSAWLEIRAIRLPQPQSGTLVVHLDITQGKQAELERIRSRTEIHHLNRVAAMGQLAASLAHELSQPLAAILSNAEAAQRFAARETPDMQEIREALDDITRDDKRARSVIQNMRAMLKKKSVVVEPVDLNQVASAVAQIIRNEAALRGVDIETTLAPVPVLVKGDEVALQQVVLNLASNGLDAMCDTRGERCLTIRTAGPSGNSHGTITVEDDGPGVSAELRDQLFQPFFTTKSSGLGMGLSICQSILESLGGRIEVMSGNGRGAAFVVELPLA